MQIEDKIFAFSPDANNDKVVDKKLKKKVINNNGKVKGPFQQSIL